MVQLEWVDAQECKDGYTPCQFIVVYGDSMEQALRTLGRDMDIIREKGVRFKGPSS